MLKVTCAIVVFAALASTSAGVATNQCGDKKELYIHVLQDASSGGRGGPNWRSGVAGFAKKYIGEVSGSRFFVSSFSDMPLVPFGCKSTGDHCYEEQVATWTANTDVISKAIHEVSEMGNWGADGKEATLTALDRIYRAGKFNLAAKDERKVVLLGTDAKYHVAGEFVGFDKDYYERSCVKANGKANTYNTGAKIDCCKGVTFDMLEFKDYQYSAKHSCGEVEGDKIVFEDYPQESKVFHEYIKNNINVIVVLPITSPYSEYWDEKQGTWASMRKGLNLNSNQGGHIVIAQLQKGGVAEDTIADAFTKLEGHICGTTKKALPEIEFEGGDPGAAATFYMNFDKKPTIATPNFYLKFVDEDTAVPSGTA